MGVRVTLPFSFQNNSTYRYNNDFLKLTVHIRVERAESRKNRAVGDRRLYWRKRDKTHRTEENNQWKNVRDHGDKPQTNAAQTDNNGHTNHHDHNAMVHNEMRERGKPIVDEVIFTVDL